ncbi:MAG: glycosyltransferase family 1 protein [Rickettsiales bacterium]|nr:glycosyltransferase family 1 protein [Rickettsiales bacterium]
MTFLDMQMRIALISDAWFPQVNGVVRTLDTVRAELVAMGHTVTMVTPEQFKSVPCPTYPEIRLSIDAPFTLAKRLGAIEPTHIHIATEGPLGWAARRYCLKRGLSFTTSFHTKFAELLKARLSIPLKVTYALLRRFHAPAQAVLVATPSMQRELQGHGFTNTALWTRGVDTNMFYPSDEYQALLDYPRPIWLYVGRVSVEKNLEAFLGLSLAGTKLVVGDGPALKAMQSRYPGAVFAGVKRGEELRQHYAGSDVFVFPSKSDTFGLVMLEALACGTPVAAYPVTGPLDVILDARAGALDADLATACGTALTLKRADCVDYAAGYSWRRCAEIFAQTLVKLH